MWSVCTFWRSASGKEIMHVYGPYGEGDDGQKQAINALYRILADHRRHHPTGPLPVVKAVRMAAENVPVYA